MAERPVAALAVAGLRREELHRARGVERLAGALCQLRLPIPRVHMAEAAGAEDLDDGAGLSASGLVEGLKRRGRRRGSSGDTDISAWFSTRHLPSDGQRARWRGVHVHMFALVGHRCDDDFLGVAILHNEEFADRPSPAVGHIEAEHNFVVAVALLDEFRELLVALVNCHSFVGRCFF